MGQAVRPWMGDSHRLERALALKDKTCLTTQELAFLVEGGRLCNRHGLRLLCSGRDNVDLTLNALAATSQALLDQALGQLQDGSGARLPEDQRRDLSAKAGEALRESAYLAHWARRLSDQVVAGQGAIPSAGPRFDA